MITTILSIALFAGLVGITAWENARASKENEEPGRELAQTVKVPAERKPKTVYVRGYRRIAY